MNAATAHPIVDSTLERYADALGDDLPAYRNHVYRGLTYHQELCGAALPDWVALAWAVHDLGIWTAGTFDYLEPSCDLASALAGEFGITEVGRARTMIAEHHKLRALDDPMSEAFRVADRIDVSRGLLTGSLQRSFVKGVVRELPYLGFHAFLVRGLLGYAATHPRRPFPMLRW
ncbi:hypothetical protein [Chlorobium tepidum TLS] [Mycobacterium shimoidei]|uniref:HD domain-containing protein n=1 Tax=Mycobacterium shimoidei TaxID=29313 RepID=A0A375Z4N8_MYCSH|nr:hypothetical protein [Mycobacterium shimoidei]SRX96046.1 hypothetical protein [Chlorobium tepidum TLS] [Mycobacterium shimoidei]